MWINMLKTVVFFIDVNLAVAGLFTRLCAFVFTPKAQASVFTPTGTSLCLHS